MHSALSSADPFPVTEIPRLGGGTITLGRPETADWQLVLIYRGLHCPICKQYLTDLEPRLSEFAELGIEVVAVSADPEAKARKFRADQGLSVPIGCDLSIEQMKTLGLYISDPRSPEETDRPFSEPGLFLINPQGNLHMVDISNAPFLRPDLEKLPSRIKFVLEKDYPIRGTHSG
ncbi:MAG: peroxiredoxin-like family protein [Marinovum algicola]|uniref:Peroxiredoxin n=1 Tax=Marinovum algicola TaxID=42444 RepID=A0A975ZMH8_9RHOB|nr:MULTISPECIES: peroxiredoxin-like family protein [Marinovum]MDD9738711.1 peroxiredoxin-like family protein [Marinovum sp. SP66]MDD9746116.1 peroxiredoxin-like family protein [Marinovum sp. PR37]SEI95064.1 Peroxiredoxin [Marinovum algicola]SLN10645.1 Putative peroxiredoxin/MT2597 [Marinovum algicola]